ncbi:MAG: Vgb family protein [Panacagrimonas sp.]
MSPSRYPTPDITVAAGWSLATVVPPSALYGANGMRFGPDGRLYVAQAFGSQISAIDTRSGGITTVSPVGGDIVAPDDLAFDSHGNLYATEVMSDRVSVRTTDGQVRVLNDGLPTANGITVHGDRIFVDEFRVGGRVLELYPDGRAPRVIADNLVLPNALSMGADGKLYFPLVANGEVWRVSTDGGAPECVATGLATPTAVKFDARSGGLVVTEAGSGQVTWIDVVSGARRRLASLRPGIDNLAFTPEGRLFVSHFTDGGIAEIIPDGGSRTLIAAGLVGPFDIAVDAAGELYVADGMTLAVVNRKGEIRQPANLLMHGFPGYIRGIALGADGTVFVTNSGGGLACYRSGGEASYLQSDLDQPMGLALLRDGRIRVCEAGRGRVVEVSAEGSACSLTSRLRFPTGIACTADGRCFVAEGRGGRVVELRNGEITSVLDGLVEPHGLAVHEDRLYVLDRGTKSLHEVSLTDGSTRQLANALPVGAAPSIVPRQLPGVPNLIPGPLHPFAGIAVGSDGAVYISGDGDGSIRRLSATRLS